MHFFVTKQFRLFENNYICIIDKYVAIMKKRLFILGIISVLLFSGCSKDDTKDWSEEVNLIVSYQFVEYYPFGYIGAPLKGINTKEENSNVWVVLHEKGIEGFEYVEGYEYYLKVLKIHLSNPPMDGSNFEYKLINIISRTEKQSIN